MQSRRHSWLEVITSTCFGYVVAVVVQASVFPFFGINLPLFHNLAIGLIFTIVSVVRSYVFRRIFNKLTG